MNVLFCFFLSLYLCLSFPYSVYADIIPTSSNAAISGSAETDIISDQDPFIESAVEVYAFMDSVSVFSVQPDDLVNCVCYNVSISGTEYILLFPSSLESSLLVDSDGYLWNVSGSQITGRLFEDSFDPTADTGSLLYLAPCLGNNFSANHTYRSPNYVRRYYWSSSDRLSYTDSYVSVRVLDTFHLFDSGHLLDYVIIFLIGCCLICLWKRAGR